MDTITDIKQYADLYGYGVTTELLKKQGFLTVSIANSSVPTMGSPSYKVEELDTGLTHVELDRIIAHKDGSVTMMLKPPYCNLRFWK